MILTNSIELDENNRPKNAWVFAQILEQKQELKTGKPLNILFNKGRYFETSVYDQKLIEELSKLSDISISYDTMIVESWKKLEDFVIALNILGYTAKIRVDWI